MPVYEYRCPRCHSTMSRHCSMSDDSRNVLPICLVCPPTTKMKRVFSFSVPEMFEEHYNASTRSYVTSKKDMQEQLRVKSEEVTARTGIQHDFQVKDRAEMSREDFGVTDDAGLKEQHDAHVKLGWKEPTPKKVM